jgi:hypothetical protein
MSRADESLLDPASPKTHETPINKFSRVSGSQLERSRADCTTTRRCVVQHGLGSVIGPPDQPLPVAAVRMFLLYPAHGRLAKFKRLRQFAPQLLPTFLRLSPLVMLGLIATGKGAWDEWLAMR